jgi:hypothetical protein
VYQNVNRDVKRQISKKKSKRWLDTCNCIEQYIGGTRTAEVWKIIKHIRAGERNRTLTTTVKMLEWKKHFKSLLIED